MNKEFINSLKTLGIKSGDILYIASDFTSLLGQIVSKYGVESLDTKLNELVDNLQSFLGKNSTILIPIFSWEFNKGKEFDIKHTKGSTGAFANWILVNRNDFLRSKHPMYSFMLWGKDAKTIAKMDNLDAFGAFSPFGYMHKNDAKMVFFDIPVQKGITFVHYVEESLQVPYRYFKSFCSDYIDENGVKSKKSYVMYVRNLAISSKELLTDEFFASKNILKYCEFDEHKITLISAKKAYEVIKDDLLNNSGKNIYEFSNYELKWGQGSTCDDEI